MTAAPDPGSGAGQEIYELGSAYSAPTALRRYIRLPGSVDEVVLMIDYTLDDCSSSYAACEVWAHADRLGSTVKTSDSGGTEIDSYTYSKFGEAGPEGDSGFPFRFTGQKLDPVTGLYNYKNRWYDPETGRFLQTDPIGYSDGMNMYAYVGNDPVNGRDPTGLSGDFTDSANKVGRGIPSLGSLVCFFPPFPAASSTPPTSPTSPTPQVNAAAEAAAPGAEELDRLAEL